MDFKSKINQAEEIANSANEKYQKETYQEILRYLLLSDMDQIDQPNTANKISVSETENGTRNDEIPEAFLVAKHGDFKHQVAWAIMKLNQREEEGNVKNVREIIDLELSLKKPSRSHTSNSLAQLVPEYLRRVKPKSGKGYVYLPNSNTTNIFDDLLNSEEE